MTCASCRRPIVHAHRTRYLGVAGRTCRTLRCLVYRGCACAALATTAEEASASGGTARTISEEWAS